MIGNTFLKMPFKVLLVLCSMFATVWSGADKAEMMMECLQKFGTTQEEVFGTFMSKGQVQNENNQNAKCVFHCFTMKNKMTDEAGNIDIPQMKTMFAEKYASKMNPETVSALIDKCAVRSETDPCEKVYQFHKCHMQEFLSM